MTIATRIIMGMPVTVEIVPPAPRDALERVFAWFEDVDRRFSPFRDDSEVATINAGLLEPNMYSDDLREVMALADATRSQTGGYFDIRRPDGTFDPSGMVKGWAIRGAARMLHELGVENFCVDAGGDIQTAGHDANGQPWQIGVRHPVQWDEAVKVFALSGEAVATSGNYVRGDHIYDPHTGAPPRGLVSLTVIADDIVDADRYATAAFAMGRQAIVFLSEIEGLEAYAIDSRGMAAATPGLGRFIVP